MKKVEHIGIAVKDLSVSIPLFEKLLNTECYKQETVESQQLTTAFLKKGETKIELLQSLSPSGVIDKFIQKRGEGIHHLAFEVADIESEIKRLQSEGFDFINTVPQKGADNKMVCFLYPKTTNGVLIEICSEMKEHP